MIEKGKPTAKAKATAKPGSRKVVIKAGTPEKVAPKNPSVKVPKTDKPKKQKMVRDSFTMPQHDYAHIATLKERCLKAGVSAKKSEILRAALACLAGLSDKNLLSAIAGLKAIKTGRPAKE
jgi:hypothetical protein